MQIYQHNIPSSHIFGFPKKEAQLQAPPGVSIDKLAELVANQVASTIIHEAAHGKRWAHEYLSNQRKLEEMSRPEEERVAEEAEQRAGLQTELSGDIFDESETTDIISPEKVLNQAITISNAKNDFYIPHNSVVNADLAAGHWGEFEMMQHPEMQAESNITVAWNEYDRKLMVDVNSIINEYNRAVQQSSQYGDQRSMTTQTDGMEPDIPGISSDKPTDVVPAPASNAVPMVQSVPSR